VTNLAGTVDVYEMHTVVSELKETNTVGNTMQLANDPSTVYLLTANNNNNKHSRSTQRLRLFMTKTVS